MPLKQCQSDGKSGWKFGDSGKCFTGEGAKAKAAAQGRAIEANKSDAKGTRTMGIMKTLLRLGDKEEIKKNLGIEEFYRTLDTDELQVELRFIDIRHTEVVAEAATIIAILEERGAEVPDVPVLDMFKSSHPTGDDDDDDDGKKKKKKKVKKDDTPVVAFVGASPSKLDSIRDRPLSGMVGKTMQDLYLQPLGLTLDDVYYTNVVKEYCENEDGKATDPTAKQLQDSLSAFVEEMNGIEPRYIVALGKTAHNMIGEITEEWVPHPRAVTVRGNSGEVERKMMRLAKKIKKPSFTIEGSIIKSEDKQIVYGVVMEPGINDSDENWTDTTQIEEAAHYFMKNFRAIDTNHDKQDIDAVPVESYVAHEDTIIGGQEVKAGSWVMGVKIEDEGEWAKIKDGEFSGFSIDAFAKINPDLLLPEA